MKILVLNYEFPPIGGGGGRVSEQLSRALASQGHEVRVQTSGMQHLPAFEEKEGYAVYRTNAWRRRAEACSVMEMGGFILTNLRPTLRHIKQWQPDLMHVHFAVPTGVIAYLAHRFTGVPYVLTAHLGDVPGALPAQTDKLFKWLKPLTKPIWSAAAAVTAVSHFVRDCAVKAYPDKKVMTIPNGIEINTKMPTSLIVHTPRRLIFAARLDPQKNPLFLIEVLYRLRDLDWTLTLFGDGVLMTPLKKK